MSWNHRVIKKTVDGEEMFTIHEVYYDDQGNPESVTKNPVPAFGNNVEELSHNLIHMLSALTKPILDYTMFEENKKTGETTNDALSMFGDKK